METVAALDLGSNTFLCLIIQKDSQGRIKILEDVVETVRLGQGLDQTKRLHPEALRRADACLSRFRNILDQYPVQAIKAVATSAARDASNSEDLYSLGRKYKIPIEIITGPKEAEVSFLGATFGHLDKDENVAVVDIGGGSTEIIVGNRNKILYAHSFDVGGVRMTERHIHTQPPSSAEIKSLQTDLAATMSQDLSKLKNLGIQKIIAVAGTPTSIVAAELGGFDAKLVDGYQMPLSKLEKWQETIRTATLEELKTKYLFGGRADIIFAGISILIHTLRGLDFKELYVSTKGVRYGVALDLLGSSSTGR